MSHPIIKIQNLSKQYRFGNVGTGTLSLDLNRWWANIRGKARGHIASLLEFDTSFHPEMTGRDNN